MKTILLQSHRPPPWPRWIETCLTSARVWARRRGIPTLFLHDELFDGLPKTFMEATETEKLPRTDLGRLRWMKRLHEDGWDRVIWLDADVFIFDQSLDFDGDAVGREAWVSRGKSAQMRVLRKVNNCAMCFDAGSPHLERYLAAAEAKADAMEGTPGRLSLGPDIMTDLHFEEPFPLHPDVAMFSPPVLRALASEGGLALRAHEAAWGGAPKAANLCGSIDTGPAVLAAAIRRLKSKDGARAKRGPDHGFQELTLAKGGPVAW